MRPHSWHLLKLSEAPSVPGPANSLDGPPAMQLHPTPFSVPWHTGGESELSMPLGPLSRHYSTDRSSSVGSMESLENPPSQGYYDSQLSPIDPAIFNNKRDSAYSSFSASSNTSDYTVSLRPEENSSMDSLLQGFVPSCRFTEGRPHSATSGQAELHCEEGIQKSRSLPRRPEAKVRPSSYSYEEEKCGPPQPPTRKDSFKATRGRPGETDKRCVSAPVGIPSLTFCTIEDPPPTSDLPNGCLYLIDTQENEQDVKGTRAETYCALSSQRGLSRDDQDISTRDCQKNSLIQPMERLSPRNYPHPEECPDGQLNHLENIQQTRMHRHSAPEKLLVSQLCMMELSGDNNEHFISPSSPWSNSLLPREDLRGNSPDVVAQGKWSGSRCSTPGSVTNSELEEQRIEEEAFDLGQNHNSSQHSWGRSVSVPGETSRNGFSEDNPIIDSQIQEKDFGTISAACSMDTLLEEKQGGEDSRVDETGVSKPPPRQFRSSKSRRRSERFATNLRNEIQRKKAQLQKSKCPGGLLFDGETVEEEDGSHLHAEEKSSIEPPVSGPPHIDQTRSIHDSSFQDSAKMQARTTASNSTFPDRSSEIKTIEHVRGSTEMAQASQNDKYEIQSAEGTRPAGVRVVEELAPPGKARRWRWTPEHKLQPEIGPTDKRNNAEGTGHSSWNVGTTRGRSGSSGGRANRADDCDIPPFADRRKFFEETSRNLSQSVTNLASLTVHRRRPEKHGRKNDPSFPEPTESLPDMGRRRFSYQGGVNDGKSASLLESRRQIVNVKQDGIREKETTLEREKEKEMERKREREQELHKEQQKLQVWKKEQEQEQDREQERARRETERVRQRMHHVERDWETNGEHGISKTVMLPPLPHDAHTKQPLVSQNMSLHNSHPDNSHSPEILKPFSAFRPVTGQQHQLDPYCPHPGYRTRSCTPTEAYPIQKMEQTKLNRKFSLTERDYAQYRRDSRPVETTVGFSRQCNNKARVCTNEDRPFGLPLRNRAMSENDIHVDTQALHSQVAASANTSRKSSVLRELDENIVPVNEAKKKKGPPPPRPPPPKWEQFHKRRASHHNLFSSQSAYISQPQIYTSCPPTVSEMTRQRSYSLPPKDGMESSQQCHQDQRLPALSRPAFYHRAFKPVTPPPNEQDAPRSQSYDFIRGTVITTSSTEPSTRLSDRSLAEQYRPAVVKPVIHKHRAEWDLTSAHNCTAFNSTTKLPSPVPNLENGSCTGPVSSESYFTMNYKYQQHLQSQSQQIEPSIQIPPVIQEPALPFETDIDEVREIEGAVEEQHMPAEDRTEMQCFAQPVTVLETDLDTVTNEEVQIAGMRRGQRASVVDSLMEEGCGRTQKELIGELFSHYNQAGGGTEGWRGGYTVSGNTLERSSRQTTTSQDSTNKAQLLNKMPDFSKTKEEDSELNYKKQLMESLKKKLGVLREAQRGLQEDIRANAQLGEEVESLVLAVCKPNEVDKFRMFIGDLDKVTSLLLSLSGRLLRVESALDCLDPESGYHERLPLMEKKKQLLMQLAEAQELKEHVDRREEAVGRVLGRCLTPEQLRDYSHFVKMKAALLVEQRQLDDKIRLGEEQLRGLKESLGLGFSLY